MTSVCICQNVYFCVLRRLKTKCYLRHSSINQLLSGSVLMSTHPYLRARITKSFHLRHSSNGIKPLEPVHLNGVFRVYLVLEGEFVVAKVSWMTRGIQSKRSFTSTDLEHTWWNDALRSVWKAGVTLPHSFHRKPEKRFFISDWHSQPPFKKFPSSKYIRIARVCICMSYWL